MPLAPTAAATSDRRLRRPGLWWLGTLGAVVLALALLLGGASRDAYAGGTPNIDLTERAPARVLYGTDATVTLSAANPAGQSPGYNLSFRAVLPQGISYVPGSAIAAPRVIADKPALGQTTLIWENLADLTPNSSYGLDFDVRHSTSVFEVADTYVIATGAYINADPRSWVPLASRLGFVAYPGGRGQHAAPTSCAGAAVVLSSLAATGVAEVPGFGWICRRPRSSGPRPDR